MNRQKFLKSLHSLVGWRESAFILALAERAAPNAELYFTNTEGVPEAIVEWGGNIAGFLDRIWIALIDSPDEASMIDLLDRVVEASPDLENTDQYGALPTADFFALLEQALLSGINENKKRAFDASQQSLDTITQFIEFSEGEGLDENALVKRFDTHPLVEREFSFQSEMSELLRAARHPGDSFIRELRTLAQDEGISNIGICLD